MSGGGDVLDGGSEADSFVLTNTHGAPTVEDYTPGEDRIELSYTGTPPVLSTQGTEGGVDLFADSQLIAHFKGISSLDLAKIQMKGS